MPSIRDQSTVDAIAREFCSNGRKKTEAMRTVGYKDGYCDNRGTGIVYTNNRVIAVIKAIDDKTAKKMDVSREKQLDRLLDAYDMAVTQGNVAGIKGILAEINLMQGYQRENAPNKEMEQAIVQRMSSEAKKLARITAMIRTDEESRKGIKLA